MDINIIQKSLSIFPRIFQNTDSSGFRGSLRVPLPPLQTLKKIMLKSWKIPPKKIDENPPLHSHNKFKGWITISLLPRNICANLNIPMAAKTMTDFNSPNNNSFTSLAAFSPSARSDLSIFFDLSTASFSPELIVHPIVDEKQTSQQQYFKNRTNRKTR